MGRPELVGPVADRMVRGLAAGVWSEGAALPSSRRLAAEFGVSFHTVMAAARRLAALGLLDVRQRRPARVAFGAQERSRGLLKRPPRPAGRRRLAILIPEFWNPPRRNPFYGTLVANLQREARRRNQTATVVSLPLRQQVAAVEQVICSGYAATIFLAFIPEYTAALVPFLESRVPLLIFNRRIPGYELPTVTLDDYGISQHLVRHLAQLGHRNLCLVASHDCHSEVNPVAIPGRGRTVGWADALLEHGLMSHCVLPVYAPWDYDPLNIYDGLFRALLRSRDRPTAIVFSHSPMAKRFLADPEFSRLAVPGDVSLATFEPTTGLPTAPGRPPLTSIHIDAQRTAQCVLETVDKIIAGVPHPPTIRMPYTIDLTDSLGPVPRWAADAKTGGR